MQPTRRYFLHAASMLMAAPALLAAQPSFAQLAAVPDVDAARMRALVDWTMLTMQTPNPVPYGAEIFDSRSGQSLMRAANAVGPDHDPSAHGEVHAIRLACQKLQSPSLRGYTLYTTCEPCPMCMACCVWAGMDRVVYGATIADATHFGRQIPIPAKEVAERSGTHIVVDGPVERELCLTLFTSPAMTKVFRQWNAQHD